MRLIKKIENVTYGLIIKEVGSSLIGINNEFRILDGEDNLIDLPSAIHEGQLRKIEQNCIYYENDNGIYKMELSNFQSKIFYSNPSNSNVWIVNDNYIFEAKRTENRREYEFELVELDSKQVNWGDVSTIRFFSKSNEHLLFTDFLGGIYQSRAFEDGREIWSLDFSANKIRGNVLLFNDALVFTTANDEIIGIDINTGGELWRLANINVGFFQVQPETNYLVSLNSNSVGDNWYVVIDPIEGRVLLNKKFENFYFDAAGNKACITETHYYFISNVMGDGINNERITNLGCINLRTHELEWIEKVGTTDSYRSEYQKPEINGNKIYLLDGKETLHIYEI